MIQLEAIEAHQTISGSVESHQQLLQGGLARPYPTYDGDFLPRLDTQVDVVQGAAFHARVLERDVLELDTPLDDRMVDVLPALLLLARRHHDLLQDLQGRLGLVVAGRQHGELHHGCDGAAGQHDCSNHASHGHQPFRNLVDPDNDQSHGHHLLDVTRQRGHGVGDASCLHTPGRNVGHRLLPTMLEHALCAEYLDGLKAGYALDQVGVLLGSQARALLDGLLEGCLDVEAVGHQDQHGDDGHHHHDAGKQPDDEEEEHRKWQINQGRYGGGGEELPHRFKLLQMLGERPRRGRAGLHLHPHHLGKDLGRQQHIRFLAGNVDEVAAQLAHHEVKGEHHHGPYRQHPEGVERQVGHYLVVDIHGEQGAGHRKEVDEDGGNQHIAIDAAGFKQRAPEPVTIPGLQHLGGALIELELLLDEEQPAIVFVAQLGGADPLRRVTGLGEDDLGLAPVLAPFQQDAGAAMARLQDAGQQQGGYLFEWLDDLTGGQTATFGSAAEECRAQTARDQWQTRCEGILAIGHTIKTGQKDQALQ
ncbi:hypothetical protein D3C72_797010 [compost metagenome]